eukprot:scpid103442/ scgid8978/ 
MVLYYYEVITGGNYRKESYLDYTSLLKESHLDYTSLLSTCSPGDTDVLEIFAVAGDSGDVIMAVSDQWLPVLPSLCCGDTSPVCSIAGTLTQFPSHGLSS